MIVNHVNVNTSRIVICDQSGATTIVLPANLSLGRSHTVQEAEDVPDDRGTAPGAWIPKTKSFSLRQSCH